MNWKPVIEMSPEEAIAEFRDLLLRENTLSSDEKSRLGLLTNRFEVGWNLHLEMVNRLPFSLDRIVGVNASIDSGDQTGILSQNVS